MKKQGYPIVLGALLALLVLGGIGCAGKPKEIPMEPLVHIYLRIAENKALETPAADLDAYTKPFGFTGADFRYTMDMINKDEQKKKQFDDVSMRVIMEEAMKALTESPDSVSADTATRY